MDERGAVEDARQPIVEYRRGMLSGVKTAIGSVYGKNEKDRILDEIRNERGCRFRTLFPFTHGGKRHGFDLDEG